MFNYRQEDERTAVLACTNGLGADYVLDQCVGDHFASEFDLLNRRGTIVIYNTLHGTPKEDVVRLMTDHYDHCPAVRAFSFHLFDRHPEELEVLKKEVFQLLAEGRIHPHIGASYPQAQAQKAHARLDQGDCLGSILLCMEE